MATSRTVATPGQDTSTDTSTDTADTATVTLDTSTDTSTTDQSAAIAAQQAQIDALVAQNAAMAEQVKQLLAAGLRTAQAQTAAPAPLPSIDDEAVLASTVPVLTSSGWFVPESSKWQVTRGNKAS